MSVTSRAETDQKEILPAAPNPPESSAESRSWWWYTTLGAMSLALGIGLLLLIYLFIRPLGMLVIGISIASLFSPLVALLERRLPRILAIIVVYLGVMILLVGIGMIVIPPIVAQAQVVIAQVPVAFSQLQGLIQGGNIQFYNNLISQLASYISSHSSNLVSVPVAFISTLLDSLIVIFISVYGLILAPGLRDFIHSMLPEPQAGQAASVAGQMAKEMGGYFRGALINGLIIGILTSLGMFVIGVNYALVLGLIAGTLEFIPVIGPIIGAVPMVLIALLQSPAKALIALVFAIALHQLESGILVPNIMRTQTSISPLLVLLALTAGLSIGGVFGALVAIPLTAALRVLIIELVFPAIRHRTGVQASASGPGG
jgi:predicted PurR-regulated permease PerM